MKQVSKHWSKMHRSTETSVHALTSINNIHYIPFGRRAIKLVANRAKICWKFVCVYMYMGVNNLSLKNVYIVAMSQPMKWAKGQTLTWLITHEWRWAKGEQRTLQTIWHRFLAVSDHFRYFSFKVCTGTSSDSPVFIYREPRWTHTLALSCTDSHIYSLSCSSK